jgi:excisionase family DNA binding protein
MNLNTDEIVKSIANDYLTTEQVMSLLGVSRQTIHNWTCSRKLPFYKFGKTLRFKAQDIQSYIESTRKEAIKA